MKAFGIILLACILLVGFTSCTASGSINQPTPFTTGTISAKPSASPWTDQAAAAALAAPVVSASPAMIVTLLDEDYSVYLDGLAPDDVTSAGKAVATLSARYEGRMIPDADMTALIKFLDGMRPDTSSLFPDTIEYPRGGLTCTDWTLKGMRGVYQNYLAAYQEEGTLYLRPDAVRLGMVFNDAVSPAYQDYFEMHFDLDFFGLYRLFSDNVAIASDSTLKHALDIYAGFNDKHSELASELGVDKIIQRIETLIK